MALTEKVSQTVFAVSHGAFLSQLYSVLTNQPYDDIFCPMNNSLQIIDFEKETIIGRDGKDQVIGVAKLRAFNL